MWMSFVQSFLQWTHKSMNFPVAKSSGNNVAQVQLFTQYPVISKQGYKLYPKDSAIFTFQFTRSIGVLHSKRRLVSEPYFGTGFWRFSGGA